MEIVKRINNASEAIEFLQKIERLNRWSRKYVVLDCPTDMAKEIVKSHVRDVSLGKRTYHYLLSGLVSSFSFFAPMSCIFKHKMVQNSKLMWFFCGKLNDRLEHFKKIWILKSFWIKTFKNLFRNFSKLFWKLFEFWIFTLLKVCSKKILRFF